MTRLEQYDDEFILDDTKEIQSIEIDGLQGYELFAKNINSDEKLIQVILFEEDGGYFLFVGTYVGEGEETIEDLRNVIFSFKRKE